MKNNLSLLAAFLLFSCQSGQNDQVKDFIPGEYVRHVSDEFSRGSDTIELRQLEGNSYEIVKRSGIIRIRNKQEMPFEYKTDTSSGIFNQNDGVINEQRKGKILSFVPEEKRLLVGGSSYQKIP